MGAGCPWTPASQPAPPSPRCTGGHSLVEAEQLAHLHLHQLLRRWGHRGSRPCPHVSILGKERNCTHHTHEHPRALHVPQRTIPAASADRCSPLSQCSVPHAHQVRPALRTTTTTTRALTPNKRSVRPIHAANFPTAPCLSTASDPTPPNPPTRTCSLQQHTHVTPTSTPTPTPHLQLLVLHHVTLVEEHHDAGHADLHAGRGARGEQGGREAGGGCPGTSAGTGGQGRKDNAVVVHQGVRQQRCWHLFARRRVQLSMGGTYRTRRQVVKDSLPQPLLYWVPSRSAGTPRKPDESFGRWWQPLRGQQHRARGYAVRQP